MTTYDPDTQEQNHQVLRDIVSKFGGTLALDTAVNKPAHIAVGDKVECLTPDQEGVGSRTLEDTSVG